MAWSHFPLVADSDITAAAINELISAINTRLANCAGGPAQIDTISAGDPVAVKEIWSGWPGNEDMIEVLRWTLKEASWSHWDPVRKYAWVWEELLDDAIDSANWTYPNPEDYEDWAATITNLNEMYLVVKKMTWINVLRDSVVNQQMFGIGGSNVSYADAWALAQADYNEGGESNDGLNQVSGYRNITGLIREVNTDSAGKIYVSLAAGWVINLYSDAARGAGDLIAHTDAFAVSGAKALVADNASGIAGTITVTEPAPHGDPEVTWEADTDIIYEVFTTETGSEAAGVQTRGQANYLSFDYVKRIWANACQSLAFVIPNYTETILDAKFAYLVTLLAAGSAPTALYENENFVGASQALDMSAGYHAADVVTPAKTSTDKYSMRMTTENPVLAAWDPPEPGYKRNLVRQWPHPVLELDYALK